MVMYRCAAMAVVMLVLSNAALAAPKGLYGGVGYHGGFYTAPDGASSSMLSGLSLRVGKYYKKNIAVEGRLLFGFADGSMKFDSGQTNADITLSPSFFALVKGDYPVSEAAKIYGVLGYGQQGVELKLSGLNNGKTTNTQTGFMYGVGGELGFVAFGHDIDAYAEYVIYPNGTGNNLAKYDYSGFNIGISKKF